MAGSGTASVAGAADKHCLMNGTWAATGAIYGRVHEHAARAWVSIPATHRAARQGCFVDDSARSGSLKCRTGGVSHFLTVLGFPELVLPLICPAWQNGTFLMGENLDDLRRRMLDRQRQHCIRSRIVNSLILTITTFSAGIVSILLWRQMSPPEFRQDHTAAFAISAAVDSSPCSSVIASRTCGTAASGLSAFSLPPLDCHLPTLLAMTGQSRKPSASAWNEGLRFQ